MQLLLFSYDENGNVIKEINCKITAAPQPISICNKKYKLLSAVFHKRSSSPERFIFMHDT